MYRLSTFVLFVAFGIVFQQSQGIEVSVTDKDGKLCLYANLMVDFSVSYEVAVNKTATANFELPSAAVPGTTSGSACDTTQSLLKLNFGEGHSWSMNFTVNGKIYQADSIIFSYNLGDSSLFPNSSSNETATVVVKPHITDVGLDTCYSCKSRDMIQADSVSQTLWNVLVQAFVTNGSKSEDLTTCTADLPTTTVAPTTTNATTTVAPTTTNATTTVAPTTNTTTTVAPTTNTTTSAPTEAPVTNTTSPPTTATPAPDLPIPATGNYKIKSDDNSTNCLLASFGLRIGVQQVDTYEMNLDPSGTTVSGSCGVNRSELVLVSNLVTIVFTFVNDTKKFYLQALNVTGITSSGAAFSEVNTTLSMWKASVSNSYMCNREQTSNITGNLTLHTFNLRVQPFGIKQGNFSTAEECFLDSDLSFLVPIAVGVALSFLIVLVLISYLIGRRKSRTGYQSV